MTGKPVGHMKVMYLELQNTLKGDEEPLRYGYYYRRETNETLFTFLRIDAGTGGHNA